jgi:hypothetical protein
MPSDRKQLVGELFETVRVDGGYIVSVKPKAAVSRSSSSR